MASKKIFYLKYMCMCVYMYVCIIQEEKFFILFGYLAGPKN